MIVSFSEEIEKIAKQRQNSEARDVAKAIALSGLGFSAGYGSGKYLYPAIMKRVGRKPKPLSGRAAALLGFMSGAAILGAQGMRGLDVKKKRINRSKNSKDSKDLSNNKQLAKRHKGHSPPVPEDILRTNAGGAIQIPGGGVYQLGRDKRGNDGGDNNRRSDNRYKYRRKKPRNNRFASPFPVS